MSFNLHSMYIVFASCNRDITPQKTKKVGKRKEPQGRGRWEGSLLTFQRGIIPKDLLRNLQQGICRRVGDDFLIFQVCSIHRNENVLFFPWGLREGQGINTSNWWWVSEPVLLKPKTYGFSCWCCFDRLVSSSWFVKTCVAFNRFGQQAQATGASKLTSLGIETKKRALSPVGVKPARASTSQGKVLVDFTSLPGERKGYFQFKVNIFVNPYLAGMKTSWNLVEYFIHWPS